MIGSIMAGRSASPEAADVQSLSLAVDKHSPIPLYYQLAELLKEQIQSGALKPGDRLPSERELSIWAGVSRMTARQAITHLVHEGAVSARQGVGTFVTEPKLVYDALHLLGFTEEVVHRGGTATSRVLEQAIVVPPPGVALGLELEPAETTVKIVRLRLAGGTPLLLETSFIPAALCPGLQSADLVATSLYAVLEQDYGLRLQRARQTLEATVANDYESTLFGITPGMAMILLEGVTYSDRGIPAEYFKAVYRGDRLKFELESQRTITDRMRTQPRVSVVFS